MASIIDFGEIKSLESVASGKIQITSSITFHNNTNNCLEIRNKTSDIWGAYQWWQQSAQLTNDSKKETA